VTTTSPVFRAAAEAILPAVADLDDAGRTEFGSIIEKALSDRPGHVRRQIELFLRVLDVLPIVRYGRRFRMLDAAQRVKVLSALETAPLVQLRRGVWGLRTLVFMGYYAGSSAAGAVGYRAHARGWLARREEST